MFVKVFVAGLVWFILEAIADWQSLLEKEKDSISDYCSSGRYSD